MRDESSSDTMFSGAETRKPDAKQMSSQALLSRMRERNRFMPLNGGTSRTDEDELFRPDHPTRRDGAQAKDSDIELLADIRNFIAFQASRDGAATTTELVERFSSRVPPKQSPLFKALLNQICTLDKAVNSKGEGVWRLKSEFA